MDIDISEGSGAGEAKELAYPLWARCATVYTFVVLVRLLYLEQLHTTKVKVNQHDCLRNCNQIG